MTPRRAIIETLFSIVYGTEAILPIEIRVEIARVPTYTPKGSAATRVEELDLVKDKKMWAFYQMERSQTQVIHAYNKRIAPRSFQVVDLVLQRV